MISTKMQNGGSIRTPGSLDTETNGKKHSAARVSRREYESMTVDQLRKLLKSRSRKHQGNKQELIKRLLEGDLDSDTSSANVSTNSKSAMSSPKSPKLRARSRSTSRSRLPAAHSSASDDGESEITKRSGLPNGSYSERSRSGSRGADVRRRTLNSQARSAKQREEQIVAKVESIAIWRSPLRTLKYFVFELGYYAMSFVRRLSDWRSLLTQRNLLLGCILALLLTVVHLGGLRERIEWYAYWCILGILSSVGLGTGLHTFLLYLGPFIAQVTIAAFECGTVNFPEPPYPHDVICPPEDAAAAFNGSQAAAGDSTAAQVVSLWTLMSKVRWEAISWGAGTAIGELPPYFVSRSARLAGSASEAEFEEEIRSLETRVRQRVATPFERAQMFVYNVIRKVGFWGILVCASIPNPLFDLAGITCGHFLIPFGTFFGATLIGKAVIKMHLQKMFVIVAFSEHHVDLVLDWTARIPFVGRHIREPIATYLSDQRAKFHGKVVPTETWFQMALTWFVYAIVAFFILSIINSLAKTNYRRALEALDDESEKDKDGKRRAERNGDRSATGTTPTSGNHSRSRQNRNRHDN